MLRSSEIAYLGAAAGCTRSPMQLSEHDDAALGLSRRPNWIRVEQYRTETFNDCNSILSLLIASL